MAPTGRSPTTSPACSASVRTRTVAVVHTCCPSRRSQTWSQLGQQLYRRRWPQSCHGRWLRSWVVALCTHRCSRTTRSGGCASPSRKPCRAPQPSAPALPPDVLDALLSFESALETAPGGLEFALRPGDLLLVDNARCLHARTAVSNPQHSDRLLLRTKVVTHQPTRRCLPIGEGRGYRKNECSGRGSTVRRSSAQRSTSVSRPAARNRSTSRKTRLRW
ncbi:MAG: hypothetical protein GEU78_16585 [Actinobacteria bacterium]|nr:hypothetical protein [Actinomycetota bacterium]